MKTPLMPWWRWWRVFCRMTAILAIVIGTGVWTGSPPSRLWVTMTALVAATAYWRWGEDGVEDHEYGGPLVRYVCPLCRSTIGSSGGPGWCEGSVTKGTQHPSERMLTVPDFKRGMLLNEENR